MSRPLIYLDHGASTPVHPQVLEVMMPFWTEAYGNPSSFHRLGRAAAHAVEIARESIARQLNARPNELIFTSCGSESDNLALRGVLFAARANVGRDHLIISQIEHSAISNTAIQLRDKFGFELTILPVDHYGRVSLDQLESAIRPNTALISIMAANNEVGTLQPVQDIGRLARESNILFHTDAVQAIATRNWDMQELQIDLMSIAPHKFYGPKGIGILYVRDGVILEPSLTGGGQEEGRRAGTENTPYIVGAAEAFRLTQEMLPDWENHYRSLRDRLISGITSALEPDCILTGHPQERLPHNASFAFRNISGNDLLMHLDLAGIAASSGSACMSGDPKPSATLLALGLDKEWAAGGLRLTVGLQNNMEEIDFVVSTIPHITEKLWQLNNALQRTA
ncbi:MAG: cysteine desulfurase family protein [Candidatus Promineifilaceae bacterium]|nr:cysteine desulfurase family protein [Candidatus Promineifilaceae bacterium]